MRVRAGRTLAAALSMALPLGCASWFSARLDAPAGAKLEDAWRLYQISEESKAMAIGIDEAAGRKVWGMRYAYWSQESANKGALSECAETAKSLGITADCHLLAVGNHRPTGAVKACADGRAPASFCDLMNSLVPPDPSPEPSS